MIGGGEDGGSPRPDDITEFRCFHAQFAPNIPTTSTTEWGADLLSRQTRNSYFQKRLSELLAALYARIKQEQLRCGEEEELANREGWDLDEKWANLSNQEKRERAAFVGQQHLAKQAKIDKEFSDQLARNRKNAEIEWRESSSLMVKRLDQLFRVHWGAFKKVFESLKESVVAVKKFEEAEYGKRSSETEEKCRKLREEENQKHSVSRDIAFCAILIQMEKEKMEKVLAKVKDAADRKRAEQKAEKAIFRGLRIVKCLKTKLKDLDVDATSKEKVSILSYSLRMIEGRLKHKLTAENKTDPNADEEADFEALVRGIDTQIKCGDVSKEVSRKRGDWAAREQDFLQGLEKSVEKLRQKEARAAKRHIGGITTRRKRDLEDVFRPKFVAFENLPALWTRKVLKVAEGLRFLPLLREVGSTIKAFCSTKSLYRTAVAWEQL